MPSHNQLIQVALNRGVRAGTVLQDAILKVRRARSKSQNEFEVALGELFVLASDAFRERNGLRNKNKKLLEDNQILVRELKKLLNEVGRSSDDVIVEPPNKLGVVERLRNFAETLEG